MKTKYALFAFFGILTIALIVLATISRSHAGYPMISGIPNQMIVMNSQTGVITFNVYDDTTPSADLDLTYISNTPRLVPADDSHIILGGSGSTRTVQVIPAEDETGTAIITIVVTDTMGETNQDSFEVQVSRPLQTP